MKKQNTSEEVPASLVEALPGFELVGLQKADQMPIKFDGREFDLANLSDEDADFLLKHPESVPYLKKLDVSLAHD